MSAVSSRRTEAEVDIGDTEPVEDAMRRANLQRLTEEGTTPQQSSVVYTFFFYVFRLR